MIVEPRPPGGAQRIARLQHAAKPAAGAAANEAEVPPARMRHQFKNDAGFAMAPHAEHNAFIDPLHALYLVRSTRVDSMVPLAEGGRPSIRSTISNSDMKNSPLSCGERPPSAAAREGKGAAHQSDPQSQTATNDLRGAAHASLAPLAGRGLG